MNVKNLEINRLLIEIDTCLKHELIFPALFMVLSIPDLCGKIEYKNNGSTKERYTNWFNKYVDPEINPLRYAFPDVNIDHVFDAQACYALRCSLFHSGDYDISKKIDVACFNIDFRTSMVGSLFNNKTDMLLNIDDKGNYRWVAKHNMSIAAILIINAIINGAKRYQGELGKK